MTGGQIFRFPHDPVLVRLLTAAHQTSDVDTIVHDASGFEKSYPHLLSDIVKTQDCLRARLPPSAMNDRGTLAGGNQHVAILTNSGYEFLVAFFSIRAMGGVCVPLGSGVLPEEAEYFLSKAKATSMAAGKDSMDRADGIRTYIHEHGKFGKLVLAPVSCDAEPLKSIDVGIDDSLQMDPDEPGLIVFSSGTTGFPKGVVLPRRCFSGAQRMEPGTTALSYRPGHWIGGAGSLIRPVLSGKKLYTVRPKLGEARAEIVLDAFKTNRITHAAFTPDLLRRMKDLLLAGNSGELSGEEKEKCSGYFKGLRTVRCSSGMLESATKNFWTDLTGLSFENIYAATELGGAAIWGSSGVQGSIGTPMPGVKVKLSEGDKGEMRIKSPNMFTHYVEDTELTKDAFDEEGYFKTGDLAYLRDGEYIFAGRAITDYVLFGVYRISTLAVESSLMDLPYISESCVVAVPNSNVKNLCGAVVRLECGGTPGRNINLAQIRSDLQNRLAPFMLPSILRILKDGEDLPRTVSGKPIKRKILEDYFGSTNGDEPPNDLAGVERSSWSMPGDGVTKPWDWCGLQFTN